MSEPDAPLEAGLGRAMTQASARSRSRSRSRAKSAPVVVVIVDRNPLFRAGLVSTLSSSTANRFRVVAACAALEDLSVKAIERSELVLLGIDDWVDPILPQIEALAERGIRVIVLGGDQLAPSAVMGVVAAGANGYLLKNEISPDVLLKSLDLVLLGGLVIPLGVARQLGQTPPAAVASNTNLAVPAIPAGSRKQGDADDPFRLSEREQAVLQQLVHGLSNKQIARHLGITEATVKVHLKSLLRKIRVPNRTQAAMWAMQNFNRVVSGVLGSSLLLGAALA